MNLGLNLILCGMPASGKSSVGQELAKICKWEFVDTDRLIERAHGSSCRDISIQRGEPFFRSLEREQIASLKNRKKTVIALGGGSLLDPENRRILQSLGLLIYLKAPTALLWKRICQRPLLSSLDPNDPEKAFCALALRRAPIYEAAAPHIIDTEHLSIVDVIHEILHINKENPGLKARVF